MDIDVLLTIKSSPVTLIELVENHPKHNTTNPLRRRVMRHKGQEPKLVSFTPKPAANHCKADSFFATVKNKFSLPMVSFIIATLSLVTFSTGCGPLTPPEPCTYTALHSDRMFHCSPYTELAPVQPGAAITYNNNRGDFPQSWPQLGHNQHHSPVFPATPTAPSFISTTGVFWAAPLTGLDFQRYRRARFNIPDEGGQVWARIMATTLGGIMGVTVAQGIVFSQQSDNHVYALDAQSGDLIWKKELVNVGGMGQAIAADVGGKLVLFVAVGDAGFTVEQAINFTNGKPHVRGAGYSAVYALDGVTGNLIWELPTRGASRVAPVYLDGNLYVATAGGAFHVINAANGTIQGTYNTPNGGFPGLAHLNWYRNPTTNQLLIYFGILRPRGILAIDVTNPRAPALAWQVNPTGAIANSPGDTAVAIDPASGTLVTTVFTNAGNAANGEFDLRVLALDATTGVEKWNALTGTGPSIPGFKASVPMINGDFVYFGNSLAETYNSYNLTTGAKNWSTKLPGGYNDPPGHPIRRRPSGASVFYEGNILQAQGDSIWTLNAASGAIMNKFQTPLHTSGTWAVVQPAIVGKQMYLSSLSGWVFAVPVDHVMSTSGAFERPEKPNAVPKRQPESYDPAAAPTFAQASQFGKDWKMFAGGQERNSVVAQGPAGITWTTALNGSIALNAPPRDEALYGTEIATLMTHWAFGVGTGVTPANGILYVGSDRFTVNALNAVTGELIWRHRTANFNFGQPLVTTTNVIVAAGDPWMTLGLTGPFRSNAGPTPHPDANLGERLPVITALDLKTGVERWSVYTSTGTSAMTPLFWDKQSTLFLVNGEGHVWAMNAATGTLDGRFLKVGVQIARPNVDVGGYNGTSSANIFKDPAGDLMIVGTAAPNKMTAINLSTTAKLWDQTFPGINTHLTGFAATTPAVSQSTGFVVGTVIIDADYTLNTATLLAFALNAKTGAIVWTAPLGSGPIPADLVAATPVINATHAYFNNPLSNEVLSVVLSTGAVQWRTGVTPPAGKKSWGPGVLVNGKLIQPVGPDLVTFNATTGLTLNTLPVGGSFTFNHPTVAGKTLYIGNSWGHVHAFPLGTVTGDLADN